MVPNPVERKFLHAPIIIPVNASGAARAAGHILDNSDASVEMVWADKLRILWTEQRNEWRSDA